MFRRLLTEVLILPGTVVALVPTLLVFLSAGRGKLSAHQLKHRGGWLIR